MSNYLDTVFCVDEDGMYYAVPEGHPWLKDGVLEVPPDSEDDDESTDTKAKLVELSYDVEEAMKLLALRHVLKEWDGYLAVSRHDDDTFESGGHRSWLVVTDERADELWDQELENYLDECVLGEMPELAKTYFDREKWKHDARIDGRAHSLNRYDGNEDDYTVTGPDGVKETYYIYRTN